MPLDYLPTNDRELLAWLKNFTTTATANKSTLGLTEAELTEMTDARNTLDAKLTANDTAQRVAIAATEEKNRAHQAAASLARKRARAIQARDSVPDSLRDQLGLTVRDATRTSGLPETPPELLATPHADGTNTLKWKAGGNKPGTQYLIEARTGESAVWRWWMPLPKRATPTPARLPVRKCATGYVPSAVTRPAATAMKRESTADSLLTAAAHPMVDEAGAAHLLRGVEIAAIEDEVAAHRGLEFLQIDLLELVPLRHHHGGVGSLGGLEGALGVGDLREDLLAVLHRDRIEGDDLAAAREHRRDDVQ